MKKKITLMLMLLASQLNAQLLFEKKIYNQPMSAQGDLVLKDIVLSNSPNNSYNYSTGHYNHSQDSDSANHRVVLIKNDSLANTQFNYQYAFSDGSDRRLNAFSNSVIQDSNHVIMVGKFEANSYYGSSVYSGGDIMVFKTDLNGNIITHKQIDCGGDDVAYSIKLKVSGGNRYIVTGSSLMPNGYRTGFVMEINSLLNVVWFKQFNLQLTAGTSTQTELFDAVYDGSSIWAIGKIRNNGSVNSDGLIVRLTSTGAFTSAKRISAATTDKETFRHVEMDGSNLIIAGDIIQGKLISGVHMLALQYNTSTSTVTKALRLNSGHNEDSGADILRSAVSGNTLYYVVGEAFPSSTNNRGVLYTLDANFVAIRHKQFGHSGDAGINAITSFQNSNSRTLFMNGYFSDISSPDYGYLIKSNSNGKSGCSDSLQVDTLRINFNVANLLDSIDTLYSLYNIHAYKDSILDSLICYDSLSMRIGKYYGAIQENKSGVLYPNPVRCGESFFIECKNNHFVKQYGIYSLAGHKLSERQFCDQEKSQRINTAGFPRGSYLIRWLILDENGMEQWHNEKLIID